MIPTEAEIGGAVFYTALFPKDGAHLIPLKAAVRRQTQTTAGDRVIVALTVKPTNTWGRGALRL